MTHWSVYFTGWKIDENCKFSTNLVDCMHKIIALLISFILVTACQSAVMDLPEPRATREAISQWVVSASASSEYGYPDWGSQRVIGPPDVNICADDPRAWASGRGNGVEWLLLEYGIPVFATQVNIYQTYGRGAVSRVTIFDPDENGEVIWEGEDKDVPCPGVLSVPVPEKLYRVSKVRIDLDESRIGYWNQIDSVELVGYR
jgi:hypothetical protein